MSKAVSEFRLNSPAISRCGILSERILQSYSKEMLERAELASRANSDVALMCHSSPVCPCSCAVRRLAAAWVAWPSVSIKAAAIACRSAAMSARYFA